MGRGKAEMAWSGRSTMSAAHDTNGRRGRLTLKTVRKCLTFSVQRTNSSLELHYSQCNHLPRSHLCIRPDARRRPTGEPPGRLDAPLAVRRLEQAPRQRQHHPLPQQMRPPQGQARCRSQLSVPYDKLSRPGERL